MTRRHEAWWKLLTSGMSETGFCNLPGADVGQWLEGSPEPLEDLHHSTGFHRLVFLVYSLQQSGEVLLMRGWFSGRGALKVFKAATVILSS